MTSIDARDAVARNGHLLAALARELGSAYVYDLDAMRENARAVRRSFPSASVYYALKANPLQELVELFAQEVRGFEIASAGELEYLLERKVAGNRIIFAGPAKSVDEITLALANNVRALHVESRRELMMASRAKQVSRAKTILAVRVNTLAGIDAPFDQMVGGSSRFGIDQESLSDLVDADELAVVEGLHVYEASQIRDWISLVAHFEQTLSLARDLVACLGRKLRYINIGGGFGVRHAASDPVLEIAQLGSWLETALVENVLARGGEIAIELGRYLTAPYGVLVTSVRESKVSRGVRFVLTDCGYNSFLRPMLTGEPHELIPLDLIPLDVGSSSMPDKGGDVIVGGPLCTAADTFGTVPSWSPLVGDPVAIANAGAYGWSMSPHFFLGHPMVAEAVIEDHSIRVVRRRVGASEYLSLGRV